MKLHEHDFYTAGPATSNSPLKSCSS